MNPTLAIILIITFCLAWVWAVIQLIKDVRRDNRGLV